MISCTAVAEQVVSHIGNGFDAYPIEGGCVIVTPFLRPDFDHIELYMEQKNNGILITDDGDTIGNLFVSGLKITKDLQAEIANIATSHGVHFANSTMSVGATDASAGDAFQRLLNAVQAVTYLIYKRSHVHRPTFGDQVEEFLLENRVSYSPNYFVQGKGDKHTIPYYINGNRNIMLEPVTANTASSARNQATRIGYQWLDMRAAHVQGNYTVIIDDRGERWGNTWENAQALHSLSTSSDTVIRWEAERPRLLSLLGV